MKNIFLALIILFSFIKTSAQDVINPYVAVGGGYTNYSGSVLNSYYPVLGVMAEHGAGQKMLVSTGYGGGLLDMFTKISSWSRKPTIGNIDSTNFIAIGQNGNSYTPGNFMIEGNVGIGTVSPRERLSVNGNIRSKEVKVEATNWPDYVFEEDYNVGTLKGLESYIKANKHLPEIPTAKEVEANGMALGEMNKILLKKVEELTLHLIKENDKALVRDKEIDELKTFLQQQQNRLGEIELKLKKNEK